MKKLLNFIESNPDIVKIIISAPYDKKEINKIIIRPVIIGKDKLYQCENYTSTQVFHRNIPFDTLLKHLSGICGYKQYNVITTEKTATSLISKNGVETFRMKTNDNKKEINYSHDKSHDYLLKEGKCIPALIDMGVFNEKGQLIKAMSDKYRQIDRFVRIVDDVLKNDKANTITAIDFGCGKSYLTFIMYYYFNEILHKDAKMTGYDLKKEVVENCNKTAQKYGYTGLEFRCGDVFNDVSKSNCDIIMSLHACDTATDAALFYAISNKVKYIFSVPCCQHELNHCINNGGDFDILLDDGILKDRFCALLTDAIRIKILECFGYKVSVLEFVEFAHSPKNLMLRAVYSPEKKRGNLDEITELLLKYNIKQTLVEKCKALLDN